jgi:hypothetical protein
VVPENVRQLIRETDKAFEAVGSALDEAKVATQAFEDAVSPISPTFTKPRKAPAPGAKASATAATATIARGILKKPPKQMSQPIRVPSRRGSASKAKRKRSKRSKRREQTLKPPPATRSLSRWTLTDNVSEMFNGRFFNRIVADEMITPSQVEQFRHNRISQLEAKKSSETMRTDTTDGVETPVEPFHLQDLPTRIGSSGVKLTLPSPIEEVPTPKSFEFGQEVKTEDFSLLPQTIPEEDAKPLLPDRALPALPSKSPLRPLSPRKQLPPLPTIPEIMVTRDTDGETLATPVPALAMSEREKTTDSNFLFFRSSPYSMACPSIRHGAIRFAKADLCMEPRIPADETLDWTAFQMAILGGAGDFFSDTLDFGRTADGDEADEIAAWLDALGLGVGGLASVPSPSASPRSRSRNKAAVTVSIPATPSPVIGAAAAAAASASPTTADSPATPKQEMVQQLPIPLLSEYPSGFWNDARADTGRFLAASSMGLGVKRWGQGEGHPRRPSRLPSHRKDRRESAMSVESLPQSPMLDLVVSRGADGDEYIVPMGYNLGHDLGDFLRWEAENVYAAEFGIESTS